MMKDYVLQQSLAANHETAEVIRRFQDVFLLHDPAPLNELVAENCVMESARPAPNGVRHVGYEVNIGIWRQMAADRSRQFDFEEVFIAGDRATIRWRYQWGPGEGDSVRGVSLMRISGGVIVEALAYVKGQG